MIVIALLIARVAPRPLKHPILVTLPVRSLREGGAGAGAGAGIREDKVCAVFGSMIPTVPPC
jgi:hypothetical protein